MPNAWTYTATVSADPTPADPGDLTDEIAANAAGPAEVRGDAGSVRQHPLPDQIKAHHHLQGEQALGDRTKRTFGIRMGKLVAAGARSQDP